MTFLGVTKCCECWFLKFWACFDDFWRFFIIFYVKKMTFLPLLKIVKPLQRFRLNKVMYFCVIINVCPPPFTHFSSKNIPKKEKPSKKWVFISGDKMSNSTLTVYVKLHLNTDIFHILCYFHIVCYFLSILVSNMASYRLMEAALKLQIVVNSLDQFEITSSQV